MPQDEFSGFAPLQPQVTTKTAQTANEEELALANQKYKKVFLNVDILINKKTLQFITTSMGSFVLL